MLINIIYFIWLTLLSTDNSVSIDISPMKDNDKNNNEKV